MTPSVCSAAQTCCTFCSVPYLSGEFAGNSPALFRVPTVLKTSLCFYRVLEVEVELGPSARRPIGQTAFRPDGVCPPRPLFSSHVSLSIHSLVYTRPSRSLSSSCLVPLLLLGHLLETPARSSLPTWSHSKVRSHQRGSPHSTSASTNPRHTSCGRVVRAQGGAPNRLYTGFGLYRRAA